MHARCARSPSTCVCFAECAALHSRRSARTALFALLSLPALRSHCSLVTLGRRVAHHLSVTSTIYTVSIRFFSSSPFTLSPFHSGELAAHPRLPSAAGVTYPPASASAIALSLNFTSHPSSPPSRQSITATSNSSIISTAQRLTVALGCVRLALTAVLAAAAAAFVAAAPLLRSTLPLAPLSNPPPSPRRSASPSCSACARRHWPPCLPLGSPRLPLLRHPPGSKRVRVAACRRAARPLASLSLFGRRLSRPPAGSERVRVAACRCARLRNSRSSRCQEQQKLTLFVVPLPAASLFSHSIVAWRRHNPLAWPGAYPPLAAMLITTTAAAFLAHAACCSSARRLAALPLYCGLAPA